MGATLGLALAAAIVGAATVTAPTHPPTHPPTHAATHRPTHPPPTVHVQVEIGAGRIASIVTAELQVWNAWLGLDLSTQFALSEQQLEVLRGAAAELFRDKNPVIVAGARLSPTVERAVAPADYVGVPSVAVHLVYACGGGEPREIDFRWDTFEETDWFERPAVPAMIKFAGEIDQAVFTPEEPQFIWHTREVKPRRRPEVAPVAAPPPLHLFLPLVSIALLLGVVVGVPLTARLRTAPVLRWGALAAGLLAALLLRDVGTVRVRTPWSGVAAPSPERAIEVFETLHGNIYRAFAAGTEDEIYDLLAVSVDDTILDSLYGDVYESLILRGQGGAVCTIEKVEVLGKDVAVPEDASELPRFDVDWQWRVHGVVSHWGHQHRRMNRYRAKYTVRHDGRSWKIAAVEVIDHERVDQDD